MIKLDHPYLHRKLAKGREYFYYRRGSQYLLIKGIDGKRLQPSDPGFMSAYEALHGTFERPETEAPGPGTLAALIVEYRQSSKFRQLSPRSQQDYGQYLDLLRNDYGHLPVRTMPRPFVFGLQEKYAATPRKANYLISVLRRVMQFAVNRGYRDDNPAAKPERLKEGPGHRPWEEFEVTAFRRHFPGPTFERVAFELLLNTAQRGGDVAGMMRQHRHGGSISVSQNKTGTRLLIPEAQDLTDVLEPYLDSHDGMMLLVTAVTGAPVTVSYLQHKMIKAYRAVGLDGVTTHGLRYTAATRLAEIGCTWATIGALTGHKTALLAQQYSGKAREASAAITKLERKDR